jgi:DMSO/TMAO reductase YedYZ molybdopterin-dependent catalytic subunit
MRSVRLLMVFGMVALISVAFVYAVITFIGSTPAPLNTAELKEYQGQKLSSVDDFRENSINGPQHIDINNYTLSVKGMVNNTKTYTYGDVLAHDSYKKVSTLNCVEGWSVTILWEGVPVKDLIAGAGVKPGAGTIIFYAADGYTTSFPLDYIMDNNIMLAYKMNNITMPPGRGYPFQLVAEDKWGYKWIKWVTAIELSDRDFTGYWEQRGYSNDGSLNKSFYG